MKIICTDCLDWLRSHPDNSVDLVFTSPPYEDARTYGIGFSLKGQDWVDWCLERYVECVRVCRGLVAWVVEGKTRQFRWSATPALLMSDLHRRGVKLRKPPSFKRVGIPGSGGPDWLRNDYEFIVCSSKGRLPWSDNTAIGAPCKYGVGGVPSHRMKNGDRANAAAARSMAKESGITIREASRILGLREKHGTSGYADGKLDIGLRPYVPPDKANPGNVIECAVGGGKMGSKMAHENEAPFPEELAEFFIRSFCPPDGIVLDPFCGSGTTLAVAKKFGRDAIGIDIRQDQCDLSERRVNSLECTYTR